MTTHSMTKRIMTALLTLALLISLMPLGSLTAQAAGGKTVYFENTDGWSTVNVYYWSASNTAMTAWPGSAMTLDTGIIYSYDLPEGVEYVIFNNGSAQTADLSLPDAYNLYSYDTGSWSQYGCAHSWGEETLITAATCTEAGSASVTCSLCSESKTVAVPALGHSYVNGACSRCGLVQTVIYFDASGSGWTAPYIYTWTGSTNQCGAWPGAAMEAVEGVDGLFCYGLSELPENVIFNNGNGGDGNQTADLTMPTDGKNLYSYAASAWSDYDTCTHSWDEGSVTTAATCTDDGVLTYTCTLCGETDTEAIPATGHSFENGSCTLCGAVESCTEHSWDEGVVTKEKTCWVAGIRTYTCTLCGETKEETIYAGHDRYVAQIIEPTCTSTGKEITKCTGCAYSYDRTLPKIAHSYAAGEVVAPTCTEDGYTVYTCTACAATTNGDLVYHTGHSWSGNTCTTCGAICEHTYADGICTSCGNGGPAYVQGWYEIENAAQLYWFAAQVNGGNNAINGKLIADIDLEGGTWTSIGYYCSDTLTPDTVPYIGSFDGQGHTVSNFTTAGTDNEGLFGYCSSATIQNVGVINANVTGWRAGAVAGYPLTSNVINCFAIDCTVTGKTTNSVALLSGTVYIAPVVSPQGGIVSNCYALNCTLIDDTDLAVYATPVGGTDTQNGYYCNTVYANAFDSLRNSTEVTEEQLASGEVTYLLNKGITDGTQAWYQTCGTGLPAHSGLTVYQVTGCGTDDVTYSNDPNAAGGHSYEAAVTAPTCTEPGYTTYTCTCGDSYVADQVAALGHSYENGTCTLCGAADPDYVEPVVQPTVNLEYPTVSFEDVIVMNVYYTADDLEDVVEMGLIIYSSNVSEWNIENAEEVIPGYTYSEDKQLYCSSTNGIAAKNLGDTLYFTVYAKLSDGSYTYAKLVSYSPETYAYAQLSTGSADIKPLVVAMLKYGAAAQTFFGHNTGALVDRNLTAEQLALIEDYRSDMMDSVATADDAKQGTFLANGGYVNRYPTVSFEGAFSINYYCTPSAAPVDGITMYYWNQADYDAAEVLTADNATAAYIMDGTGTGRYQTAVEGIAAKDLDKGVYVCFVYSDGTTTWSSGVLAYSIGMYCNTNAAGTADVAPLAAATAVYGYHAKQTFYKTV